MAPLRPTTTDRLLPLDGLRGLAAMLVVAYHFTTRYQELYGHPAPLALSVPLGHYGVQLFFLVSGFVIFMSLQRTGDVRDFLVSRLARLFPAYWLAVLLTATVVALCSLPGREVPVSAVWTNLSMLQAWLDVPHVDGVYWTLTVELAFYAGMLILHLTGLLRHLHRVVLAGLAALLLHHWAEARGWLHWSEITRLTLLLDTAHLFFAGMLLHRLYLHANDRLATALLAACLGAEWVLHGSESAGVCTVMLALFLGVVRGVGPITAALSWSPLVWIGTISYSLYLLHQNIGYVLLRALYAAGATPGMAIPATVGAVLALAALSHRLVEVPGRRIIRGGWNRMRERRTA